MLPHTNSEQGIYWNKEDYSYYNQMLLIRNLDLELNWAHNLFLNIVHTHYLEIKKRVKKICFFYKLIAMLIVPLLGNKKLRNRLIICHYF